MKSEPETKTTKTPASFSLPPSPVSSSVGGKKQTAPSDSARLAHRGEGKLVSAALHITGERCHDVIQFPVAFCNLWSLFEVFIM